MKILQVHAAYRFAAGEDVVVANEAAALRTGGHDVRQVIVPNPRAVLKTLAALARCVRNRSVARRVARTIRDFDPDVVHVHNTWFVVSPAAIAAAHDCDRPVVMTVHNYRLGCLGTDLFRDGDICTACINRSPWPGVVHGCYRDSRVLSAIQALEIMMTRRHGLLDRCVTRFVAPSAFMADRLVDIGLPRDRLSVKPHFTADPGPREAVPSSSGAVVAVGRLVRGKGFESLLCAWERIDGRVGGRESELVIIGDGPLGPSFRRSSPPGVRFAGWQSHAEVMRQLLGARALVFPSEWYEPFGMVLIEALSAGLPIVTSNASGARWIADVPEDFVFTAGDDRGLAAALRLLTDDVVDDLGRRARRRFEEHFSVEVGIRKLEALYTEAIAGRVRSA